MNRALREFPGSKNFRPAEKIRIGLWFFVQHTLFKSAFCPSRVRPFLLRTFGSSIGNGVVIRRGVRVHFPWNLEIGDDCWIGEEVWFINHEKILVESNVCISQRSIVCSSSHDFRSTSLEYAHKPVHIKSGAWICLDAKVLPGVTIGAGSVVSAGEVARETLSSHSMLIGGLVRQIGLPPADA